MKPFHILFLFCSLFLGMLGCKDESSPTPDTCKLAAIDRGNGNKHSYAYDASGRITQMNREFDGSGSGKISHYVLTFTYDASGLLIKTTSTLEGKPDNTETYTYTNGLISKVTFANADGTKGINSITYNAAGQIAAFSYETGDPTSDIKEYFTYNADGVVTETGFTDLAGTVIFFQVVYKPVGKITSPEQLLAKHGLPYDVLTGTPWSVARGDVGSTFEFFVLDDTTGKLVSAGSGKTTAVSKNAQGYLTSLTTVDDTKQSSIELFTLTGCN